MKSISGPPLLYEALLPRFVDAPTAIVSERLAGKDTGTRKELDEKFPAAKNNGHPFLLRPLFLTCCIAEMMSSLGGPPLQEQLITSACIPAYRIDSAT